LDKLIAQSALACRQPRSLERLRRHLLSNLLCLERHTLTGLLATSGDIAKDWSADYRLYAEERVVVEALFETVRRGIEAFLPDSAPLVVALDDSLLRKVGRKIPGTAWRRDPLGPRFQTNLVWAQRVLQLSAALPFNESGAVRMIPIAFVQAPTPAKLGKNATPEQVAARRRTEREMALGNVAAAQVAHLSKSVARPLHVCADGGYTNATVLKKLPPEVCLIGRLRADAKIHQEAPATDAGRGRPRWYGQLLPTPEEIRQSDEYPWRMVRAYAAGRTHEFRIKTLPRIKWRCAGAQRTMQLLIIAPLEYRLNKQSRVLYRRPAYVLCTDPLLPPEKVLQEYIWRSDIEVNFRDEKSLLGVGEAQVRNPSAVTTQPASAVAAYALLLLAAAQTFGPEGLPDSLPQPRWRAKQTCRRASTNALLQHLRYETWGKALDGNLCDFRTRHLRDTNSSKMPLPLAAAVLFARRA
jgi:hypothetical protein